ncbi:MAG: DMT family protein [Phycisphaerae bacterium]
MFRTVLLLIVSNVAMTFAWYGHLKHKDSPLWKAIVISWLIAGVEYVFQVPANRIGSNAGYPTATLKIVQEAITLVVFVVFAWLYLGESMRWNHYAAFALIWAAVFLVFFVGKPPGEAAAETSAAAVDRP